MATISLYNSFFENQFSDPIDFNDDTIKVSLHTSAYTPDASTHDFYDDVTNEVTGGGYTAGGETIQNATVSESSGTASFDGDDVTWTQNASGFSNARYAVIYKDTGTPGTSPLIGYIDMSSDKGNVAGDLSLQWNASGIMSMSAA